MDRVVRYYEEVSRRFHLSGVNDHVSRNGIKNVVRRRRLPAGVAGAWCGIGGAVIAISRGCDSAQFGMQFKKTIPDSHCWPLAAIPKGVRIYQPLTARNLVCQLLLRKASCKQVRGDVLDVHKFIITFVFGFVNTNVIVLCITFVII